MAEVGNFSAGPITCGLRVMLDGEEDELVPLELPAGDTRRRFFDVAIAETGRLIFRLDRADDFSADNEVFRDVPPVGDRRSDLTSDATEQDVEWADLGESDLRSPGELGIDAAALSGGRAWPAPWLYLAALGVLLLAVEWCLYQRRWTC